MRHKIWFVKNKVQLKGLHLSQIELFTSTAVHVFCLSGVNRVSSGDDCWRTNQRAYRPIWLVMWLFVNQLIGIKYHKTCLLICISSDLYAIEQCHTKTCASFGFINLISKHILLNTWYPILLATDFPINMLTNPKKGNMIETKFIIGPGFICYKL